MNQLLYISKDSDIINTFDDVHANSDDVEAYMDGTADPPPLIPLLIFWDVLKVTWNEHLADLFAAHLIGKLPELAQNSTEISNHFMQRLESLRKHLAARIPRTQGETPEEITERIEIKKQQTLQVVRQRRRRGTVSQSNLTF